VARKEEHVETQDYASLRLGDEVIDKGLCPLCGGCASGCPYLGQYKGKIVQLDCCTLMDGSCYRNCPRTYTDLDALSQSVFGQPFSSDDIGIVRGAYLARATEPTVRAATGGGGVVAALLAASLGAGIIDAVVTTSMSSDNPEVLPARNPVAALSSDETPVPVLARGKDEVLTHVAAAHRMARVLAGFNTIPKESGESLGMVCLPCQVASLRKRTSGPADNRTGIENVRLLIAEFCAAKRWLEPGEDRQVTNKACSYCWDYTGELADISVGSGRAKFQDWNAVLVRSEAGTRAFEAACDGGAIERQPLPDENLAAEKKASLEKKRRAVRNITDTTGDRNNMLYLGMPGPIIDALLVEA
jgi:coenzyme F420 hydrogenase subunit beta